MQPTPPQISNDLQMCVVGLLWLSCRVGTRLHIGQSYFGGGSVPSNFLLLCYRCRLWTPSRWPAVSSPRTLFRVSIFSPFKLNSGCSFLEDKNKVSSSVAAIPMRPGIFEIVFSFNRPLTWQRWIHEPFPSPTNRYCSSLVKLIKLIN